MPDRTERPSEAGSRAGGERAEAAEPVTAVRGVASPDATAAPAVAADRTEPGEDPAGRRDAAVTVAAADPAKAADGAATAGSRNAGSAGTSGSGSGDSAGGTVARVRADTPELPVRAPRSRRVGRRRAVGPVIGDQLATELLGGHRADVLLADRCACGDAFPCRSRAFATCFVTDEAYPPADLEMSYQIVPPEVLADVAPRPVERSAPPPRVPAAPSGSGTGRGAASPLPIDLDATVQFEKVPADPPPVAVAV